MKHLNLAALGIVVAAAAMTFVASASATVLTSPAGTNYTGTVKAESEGYGRLHVETIELSCDSSFEWEIESHGAAVTAKGSVSSFSADCDDANFTLLEPGTLEAHTSGEKADGNGTLTLTEAKIEANYPVPFPYGASCIYEVEEASITLVGSKNKKGPALVDLKGTWSLVEGTILCFSAIEWTAVYSVTSPTYLDVD